MTLQTCALLTAAVFSSCSSQQEAPLNSVQKIEYGKIQVVEVDSCEYVVWHYSYSGGMVHKQNCKFCTERNKQN